MSRAIFLTVVVGIGVIANAQEPLSSLATGKFRWQVSQPVLSVDPSNLPPSPEHPWVSVKDPSVIRYDGRWHLFCTLRKAKKGDGRIRIGYLSFREWKEARQAEWRVLKLTMGYHGAPQIFFFEPHKKWYLVYQAEDATRELKYGPCFSTNTDITKPEQWTLPQPLYTVKEGSKAGLDFWVICDGKSAFLFFTTLDGRMWRAQTPLSRFPGGPWTEPVVALKADIFEASHTYAVQGSGEFLTLVEAQGGGRRYFKAFTAKSLDGKWSPLAASRMRPFVSPRNVVKQSESWATSYSHGEFIRSGFNQRLEIELKGLQILFQGASDKEYRNRNYGQIPWRLGILTLQPNK